MRSVLVGGGIGLIAIVSSALSAAPPNKARPRPVAPLPVFAFISDDTESQNTSPTGSCTTVGADVSCYARQPLAGLVNIPVRRKYYQGRLYSVHAYYPSRYHRQILDALEAKYGAQDKSVVKPWQSQGGGKFDNSISVWQFKGGILEAHAIGSEVGESNFTFVSSENSPPKAPPKIDF